MVYKRVNKSLDKEKKIEYVLSNNQGVYLNSSVTGAHFAPYHGLYISEQVKNDEIFLSKMVERILIGSNKYDIMDIKTSEGEFGGLEYLTEFTDAPIPTYFYDICGCLIEKKYIMPEREKVLCIEYKVTNNTGKMVKFMANPCITRRNIFKTKRQSELKFNSLVTPNATKIALSIMDNLNLYIKSPNLKYDKKEFYIRGVNYDYELSPGEIKTYVEDLFVPGTFEGAIKSGNTATYVICVSTEDVNEKEYRPSDIELEAKTEYELRYGHIDKNYHELISLAKVAYSMQYIDKDKKQLVLLESIPTVYDGDKYIKNIITSIEGNYLILKRFKEAHKILESMMLKLKDSTYKLETKDRCEAMLLFIEAVNRYFMEAECTNEEIRPFYEYIKENIYEYLDRKMNEVYADNNHLLVVENKRYIKLNALWYNALRIFVDLADKFREESEFIYSISETAKENILNAFWDEEQGVLKYEVEDTSYPSFDMIYSLSLSYPVIHDTKIAMKLMDTAFKKLYTAYGMRLGGINTKLYDGYLYPHLMVHFLKANLRQMGVTRASQKLAYNLVKELLGEIGKYTVGTVKYRYEEKTMRACGSEITAITNAEIIRAFDMLT